MTTIDVGTWRCPCGGFLDLDDDRPSSDALTCRCPRCQRVFEVTVLVMEIVPSAGAQAA